MADEPFPIEPTRHEQRGMFPDHDDHPRSPLTADEARAWARDRLERWRQAHGD